MPASPQRRDYERRVDDRDRSRERDRDDDRGRSRRDNDRDRERERERDKDRDGDRDRDKERDRARERERERDRDRDRRRASPEYGDYKRPVSPAPAPAPAPAPPNMYPNRQPRGEGTYERDRPPHVRGGYGGSAGGDYSDSRRLQRENSTMIIWPPSPKAPFRLVSPERGSSRRKSKRDRSETPSESDDSESERRRRERKERKRARKDKEKKERKERKERGRRSRSDYETDEEDPSERDRDRQSKSKTQPRAVTPSPPPSSASEGEEEWVERPSAVPVYVAPSQSNGAMPPPAIIPSRNKRQADEDEDEDSDEELGPQPLIKVNTSKKVDERAYGGALLRGEGSAMAAFLQDDPDSRIPRRGEIGLTSDEIAQFESVGYVMSGSRHKRMNAVRMRKENQVISAEEKRGILKLQKEERSRREAILREEFNELVQEKLMVPEAKPKVT